MFGYYLILINKIEIMNSGKILLGVLIGAAAGVLAGILIAPEKGSETREKLAEMGEEYLETVKDKFDEMLENFATKFEQVKKEVNNLVEKK